MTNNIDSAHLNRQVDVIVSNIIRVGTNKHLAKEYAEYLIKFINFETPQQRTWVGLTEEDIDAAEIHLTSCRNNHESWIEGIQEFANALDAKLKEKNT
jgi:hypothetical protein